MKAWATLKCSQCGKEIRTVRVDTADMPDELQSRINTAILEHRQDCSYYNDKLSR